MIQTTHLLHRQVTLQMVTTTPRRRCGVRRRKKRGLIGENPTEFSDGWTVDLITLLALLQFAVEEEMEEGVG